MSDEQNDLDEFRGAPCTICGRPGEPDHIKSRGAGGSDEAFNLWSMCREHHMDRHRIGFMTFVRRFALQKELLRKGWELGGVRIEKWLHPIYRQRSFERMKGKL